MKFQFIELCKNNSKRPEIQSEAFDEKTITLWSGQQTNFSLGAQ